MKVLKQMRHFNSKFLSAVTNCKPIFTQWHYPISTNHKFLQVVYRLN